jgi:PAS domain S-box-containing protein
MADTEAHLALLETEFEQLLDERAQKLPGEGTTEAEEALRDRFRESRFRQLLNALRAAVYTTDAAGRISFYNEAAAELWGCRPELGRSEWCGSWRLSWPDGTPLPHHECPMALALKEDRCIRGMEAVAERPDGTRVPFIPYPTPLHDASGKLVGAVNMLVDITDRKRAEEQQALLIRELHHRVRNMLATVQAIMAATARTSGTIQEFETDFTNRIAALARTQGSIADHDRQVISVENLLLSELARFEDGWGRIALNGPLCPWAWPFMNSRPMLRSTAHCLLRRVHSWCHGASSRTRVNASCLSTGRSAVGQRSDHRADVGSAPNFSNV